jgi:hypothetical protein
VRWSWRYTVGLLLATMKSFCVVRSRSLIRIFADSCRNGATAEASSTSDAKSGCHENVRDVRTVFATSTAHVTFCLGASVSVAWPLGRHLSGRSMSTAKMGHSIPNRSPGQRSSTSSL